MTREDKILTLREVTDYLKIPKSTIYKLARNQEIPFCKIGKQLRFRQSSVDIWLSEKESVHKSDKKNLSKAKRVLIIDDDEIVLKSLSRFLKSHGFWFELAQNSDEALEKVKQTRFDLIVTDIRMPGVSGIETIRRIREINRNNNWAAVPELVITGYSDSEAEKELEKLRVSGCLYKPFSTGDFLLNIEKTLFSFQKN